jgi:TPR repeat protein
MTAKNEEEAIEWLKAAADPTQGNNPHAQLILGQLYMRGTDRLVKGEKIGIDWIQLAAKQELITAQMALGDLYASGHKEHIKRNFIKAIELYTPAATAGNPEAQYTLSGLYRWVETSDTTAYAEDNKISLDWLNKASENGIATASYELAGKYEFGTPLTPVNISTAITFYKRSSEQGDGYASNWLGDHYLSNLRGKNVAEAIKYYQLAINQGYYHCEDKLKGLLK